LRRSRKWSEVYKIIPDLRPYDGIPELLAELNKANIPIAIVTSSPSSYCQRVINHWGWEINSTVCYHDTKLHKPHPEPLLLAVKKINVPKSQVVAIGDEKNDIISAQRAKIYSVAVLWGARNKEELLAIKPNRIAESVDDLRNFLFEYYKLD